MEKRWPTYDRDATDAAIGSVDTLTITRSAFSDALSLGFSRSGIAAIIQSIRQPTFFKSMTTLTDHRTWHDVYRVTM
jgi:motility quorum-sensing regulator/GCU-specific mRNA interferase toxin